MEEIIFLVEESPEGGYTAKGLNIVKDEIIAA